MNRFAPLLLLLVCPAIQTAAPATEVNRPRILGISHAAFYVTDMAKARAFYEDFLGYASPFVLPRKNGGELVWIKINDRQTIELFPGSEVSPHADRLYHVAIETDDAEAMRLYLRGKGVSVPDHTPVGKIGNANYFVSDPNGNRIEIVQYLREGWTRREAGRFLPDTRISTRLKHVGVMVGQLDASMKFYRDILGFEEIWRGSSGGGTLNWINLKVPDGDDYVEFMLYDQPPTLERVHTMHHICLEVEDVAKAAEILRGRRLPDGVKRPAEMKTGVNGKRLMNCFDPDGTRVEIMEPGTFDGLPRQPSSAPPPPPYRPGR